MRGTIRKLNWCDIIAREVGKNPMTDHEGKKRHMKIVKFGHTLKDSICVESKDEI